MDMMNQLLAAQMGGMGGLGGQPETNIPDTAE